MVKVEMKLEDYVDKYIKLSAEKYQTLTIQLMCHLIAMVILLGSFTLFFFDQMESFQKDLIEGVDKKLKGMENKLENKMNQLLARLS